MAVFITTIFNDFFCIFGISMFFTQITLIFFFDLVSLFMSSFLNGFNPFVTIIYQRNLISRIHRIHFLFDIKNKSFGVTVYKQN